jgi:hypothetical protein
MHDQPSRLDLLRFLERVQQADLDRTRRWIADEERRQAEKQRGEEARPPAPDWLLEMGLNRDAPPNMVHIGGCHMAGKRSKGISRGDALRRLDEVVIAVGDDDMDHTVLHPDGNLTQEDVDAFVWGPFRFSPHINGTDEHGRSPEPFPLDVGTGRPLAMQRTRPGRWMEGKSQGMWQGEYVGKPIRLVLTCRRGDDEWVIARHLENPPFDPQA